jgi:hypothetical protein
MKKSLHIDKGKALSREYKTFPALWEVEIGVWDGNTHCNPTYSKGRGRRTMV